jgi:hypothetical protein
MSVTTHSSTKARFSVTNHIGQGQGLRAQLLGRWEE